MPTPIPSSIVSGLLTISTTDATSGQQTSPVVNRANNPVLFKAVQIIYNGYINLVANSTTGIISPAPGTPSFSLLYVRNGGSTSAALSYTTSNTSTQIIYLDPGSIFFWQTPQQTNVTISGIVSGINNFSIVSAATFPANNIEYLAAA
jgi:hypothetical protein